MLAMVDPCQITSSPSGNSIEASKAKHQLSQSWWRLRRALRTSDVEERSLESDGESRIGEVGDHSLRKRQFSDLDDVVDDRFPDDSSEVETMNRVESVEVIGEGRSDLHRIVKNSRNLILVEIERSNVVVQSDSRFDSEIRAKILDGGENESLDSRSRSGRVALFGRSVDGSGDGRFGRGEGEDVVEL